MQAQTNPWNEDKPYNYGASWFVSKPYLGIVNERLTGKADLHWLQWAIGEYLTGQGTEGKRCLILGSNEGWMEIAIRKGGFRGEIVASDIADRALARAAAIVRGMGLEGISHQRADLNSDTFPPESFDYVIVEGVLHHIEAIEFCVTGLKRALRPGGLLIGTEFIGAHQFQFPPAQVEWINTALNVLPRRYRPQAEAGDQRMAPDEAWRKRVYYVPMSRAALIAMDPSEAASGHLLMETLRRHFDIETLRDGGGGLVMNMAGHFPFEDTNTDEQCRGWLQVIADIEKRLYLDGTVPSDIVFLVCRRRP